MDQTVHELGIALFAIPTVEGRLAIAPASTHALVMALLEATRT
jgi:hypothetical protein